MAEEENRTPADDAQSWTEQIKQATKDFPAAKQGAVSYEQANQDAPVTKATINITENTTEKSGKNKVTVSKTEEYSFATRGVFDSKSEKYQPDVYAANPEYHERIVTTENGKNKSTQTISQTHEYRWGAAGKGSDMMYTTTSQSSRTIETKGNKTIARTSRSEASIGERTDTVYSKKGTTSVKATMMASSKAKKLTGVVNVSGNFKNKRLTTSVEYEGTQSKDGHINYTKKAEYYVVDDLKTGNSYSYKKSGDGQIEGEVWQNNGSEQVKQNMEVSKQMKKDFDNCQKMMNSMVKQASKCKTPEEYMEKTPKKTVTKAQKVDVQQQALKYTEKAKKSAQTALIARAKAKQGR